MGLFSEKKRLSDGELVERVLGGETDDFGILVERYRDEFARYASAMCGDVDTAADAMQEAFIRAYRSLASCQVPSGFKAWFFRILTNQCHTARDKRKRHVSIDEVTLASRHQPDDFLTSEEIRNAIDSALDEMTAEQREAFVLRHFQGKSFAAIAELLDDGIDAVKMRVYRARDVVKRRFDART